MKILNTISFQGNIFFKVHSKGALYAKLVPTYDVEYGMVVKLVIPTNHTTYLDKSWIKIHYNEDEEKFRINCPSFLVKYKGVEIHQYEDEFYSAGEVCRIRRVKGDFSKCDNILRIPRRAKYEPHFEKDGRFHISLAFIRNNFPDFLKKDPYIQVSLVNQAVINHEILVTVFSGADLIKGEIAFKLKKYEYEMATPPVHLLLNHLKNQIKSFQYVSHHKGNRFLVIHTKRAQNNERRKQGTGRCVPGIRERAIRARRERDAGLRVEKELRRKKVILDFK